MGKYPDDNEPQVLKVLKYHGDDGGPLKLPACHECRKEDGTCVHIDLMIDGTLPPDVKPEDLVGKRVRVDFMHPYIAIAANPRIDGGDS